jgi:imidazolonepropionase-like amidohydrolase
MMMTMNKLSRTPIMTNLPFSSISMKSFIIALLALPIFAHAQIAIVADTVYTMAGPPIAKGVILIEKGIIKAVGKENTIKIPKGYIVHRANAVTPGLIDGRSVVGLAGKLNVPGDQQQLEKSSPIQPELRALDAYDANEELIGYLRTQGVTTIHTGHAPGALISGQTLVAKTKNGSLNDVILNPAKMLAMTLGNDVTHNFTSPGTRSKGMAMLRDELIKAQAYQLKKSDADSTKWPETNLKLDALSLLLSGKYMGLIHANHAVDIQAAFRLSKEFGFPLVLDGAAEIYLFIDELKSSGASLILHPTMARAHGDQKNLNLGTAALLAAEGIPFSLQSGYESYVPKTRVVRYEAAMAAAYGLSREDALKSITVHPAQILGLQDRLGSIEKGKDADLVLYDGDPLEHLTHVCKVFIDGILVEDLCTNK